MLDYINYISQIPCPTDRPIKPPQPKNPNSENVKAWADELEGWERTIKSYNASVSVYREDQARLDALMKMDILKEYGLEGHPKAEKIWTMARESDGSFLSLCTKVEELADLVLG